MLILKNPYTIIKNVSKMGVDISVRTDKREELYEDNNANRQVYFKKHRLSRTFCNFMSRRYVACGEPELGQIGKITGIDIAPLYNMENYIESEDLVEDLLSSTKNEKEREEKIYNIKKENESLNGNIYTVLQTVNSLIESLSTIDNLNLILDDYGEDTLGYDNYFIDFNIDKHEGYVENNFGQDLRNLKCFLEYAKDKGATTVWFDYS